MYANIVSVEIKDMEAAVRGLHDEVVPTVSKAPGFVAGYWLAPKGNEGRGIILFDSEEAALKVAEMIRAQAEDSPVRVVEVETREVIANA